MPKSYTNMIQDTDKPFCWACGRDEHERPRHWNADWRIQRCHLSAGSGRMKRIEERYYVNLLCPLCHSFHRHHFSEIKFAGEVFPSLTDANMLWLKIERDNTWWERDRIAKAWIGNPPSPEAPHDYYLIQYASRRLERFGI